jgi:hypothetical protein
MPALRASRSVTQAILVEGRHRVRVYEPSGIPPPGFERVSPTLEDSYLVFMRSGPVSPPMQQNGSPPAGDVMLEMSGAAEVSH